MKIKMLKTEKGAADGIRVAEYKEGTVHDLGHSPRALELAHAFVKMGSAVPEEPEAKPKPHEEKGEEKTQTTHPKGHGHSGR